MKSRQALKHLGGNKFIAMTGAKQFLDCGDSLTFKLPKYDGLKINFVKIYLENDLYSVDFIQVYKDKDKMPCFKTLETVQDVYAEDLAFTFEKITGLRTHL